MHATNKWYYHYQFCCACNHFNPLTTSSFLLHCACDNFNPSTTSSPCYSTCDNFNPLTASSLLSCDLIMTLQVLLKLIAFRLKYFTHKFEVFDGIVVMVSFALDIASLYVCVKCMCMCSALYGSSESHLQAHQYNSNCVHKWT